MFRWNVEVVAADKQRACSFLDLAVDDYLGYLRKEREGLAASLHSKNLAIPLNPRGWIDPDELGLKLACRDVIAGLRYGGDHLDSTGGRRCASRAPEKR